MTMIFTFSKTVLKWIVLAVVIVAAVAIALGLVFGLQDSQTEPRILGAVASNGLINTTDSTGCAHIGQEMLYDGGSAVDAVIAVLLCEGVMLPHSLGIGGGFVATIYTKADRKIETLIARETAPAAASRDMFVGVEGGITGPLAVAVPGEILGYWELHQKYGKLPWKSLFQPAIKLCQGHRVSTYLADTINKTKASLQKDKANMEVFFNPDTQEPWQEHDIMQRLKLGETLEKIANSDASIIYNGGEVGQQLIADLREMGGIMTVEDLKNYRVRWESENHVNASLLNGHTLYTTPLPSSGVLLAFIMNVIKDLYTENHIIYWQRVVEAYKHAYGQRSNLGDAQIEQEMRTVILETISNLKNESFVKSIQEKIHDDSTQQSEKYYGADFEVVTDAGTANVAVLAPNGDAIVVTSTINTNFGAKIRSKQTGIIFNDQMDDFSTPGTFNSYNVPASPANFIVPGKIPMSSMCPSIILDQNGNVRMLVGAAGGTKITTSIADSIIKYLILGKSMENAINTGRIHHQLQPMQVDVENQAHLDLIVPQEIRDYLKTVGHVVNEVDSGSFAALTAIGMRDDLPVPMYDKRRVGSVATVQNRNKMMHRFLGI